MTYPFSRIPILQQTVWYVLHLKKDEPMPPTNEIRITAEDDRRITADGDIRIIAKT